MKKLIMFDYDGTLADSFAYFYRACVHCFRSFGFPQYANRESVVAFHDTNWFEALAAAGVPPNVRDAIEETYDAEVSGDGPRPEPFPGVREVLLELGSKHIVVVITAARTRVVERFLSDHAIDSIALVLGSDTETSKVRRIAAARERFKGLEPWYVGDTVGDIREGREAGVGTVAATWGWHSLEQLEGASPDLVAEVPADLLTLLGG